MGCCCCARGYSKIPEYDGSKFDDSDRDVLLTNGKFNFNSSVFKGLTLDQKFTNTSSFDRRYVWVNYETKTLHMSQHESKEGRHKEASLGDIKNLELKPPSKFRKKSENEPDLKDDVYLTISFIRGGSIDLRFKNSTERNVWYNTLSKLVAENLLI
jgi:hypothetical protein